jgi:uncharacterized membrane protein
MNRTQKAALFSLIMTLLGIALLSWMSLRVPTTNRIYGFCIIAAIFLLFGITTILKLRKQRPQEVISDERDNLIKRRATTACFVSVLMFLVLETVIVMIAFEGTGKICVAILPELNICLLLAALLVYSVAILVQYGLGTKDAD